MMERSFHPYWCTYMGSYFLYLNFLIFRSLAAGTERVAERKKKNPEAPCNQAGEEVAMQRVIRSDLRV